jgi:hypothetical protein
MKLHLQIPDSIKDITLKQYMDFERVNIEGNQDSIFLMQKTVEIFCNVNLDLTLQIKYNDLKEITNHIYSLLMHKAMSILYRPIEYRKGNRYLIEDYKGTDDADKMLNVSLDVPLGAMVFFWNLRSELLSLSLNYSRQALGENLTSEQLQTLEVNGVGINQSLHSLTAILNDLKISQNYRL